MEHLTLEALSRLVDEAPTAPETDHLSRCGRCASELDALRGQKAALGGLPDVRPPRGAWEEVEARLLAEGLIRTEHPSLAARVTEATPWLRRAAAVAVFLTGAAAGAGVTARLARGLGDAVVELASVTDPGTALAHVQDAERAYIGALTHYRQLISAREGSDVVEDAESRYAALEQVVQAGQAAVTRAPADPFLNGLLAQALAERAAHRQRASSSAQDGWF